METLRTIWNYPLFHVGDGPEVLVRQLALVLVVLLVGYVLSKLVERMIRRRLAKTDLRADAAFMLQRIIYYVLLVVLAMMALSLLNVPLTAFAFVSGAVALGVGFGAQNVVNNFISGWILLFEKPVRIDDFIEVDSYIGTVERIGNRSTRIRRPDGVRLLIPNSKMLEHIVVNWTLIDQKIRTVVRVGVAYGSPTKRVAELIEQAVNEQPETQSEPAPMIILEDFADNAVLFEALFWCQIGGKRELRQIRSAVRFRIEELFAENDIVIAFPQRDVHLDTPTPIRVQMVGESGDGG